MRPSQGTPAPDPSMQRAEHGGERGTFSPFEKRLVETVFGLEHFRGVSGIVGLFHDLERPFQPRDLRVAGLFHKEARREALEDSANRVKIARFFHRQGAHDWSFIGNHSDEAFGLQLTQGFANDRARNSHHGDQFAFQKPVTGIQSTGNDGLAQFVEDLAAKRRGRFGDGREKRERRRQRA